MIMMVVYIIMMVEFILSPVIGWEVTGEAAGKGRLGDFPEGKLEFSGLN
jgi:hypothetical protein